MRLAVAACLLLATLPALAAVDIQKFYAPLEAVRAELVRYKLGAPEPRKAEVVIKRRDISLICRGSVTLDTGTVWACDLMVDDRYEYALRLWGEDKRRLEPDSIVCVKMQEWRCAPGTDASDN